MSIITPLKTNTLKTAQDDHLFELEMEILEMKELFQLHRTTSNFKRLCGLLKTLKLTRKRMEVIALSAKVVEQEALIARAYALIDNYDSDSDSDDEEIKEQRRSRRKIPRAK